MSSEGSSANPTGAAVRLLNERYELGERLTESSFFHTYRGRDTQSGQPVAIKVLRPEYASEEAFASRLLSEAESAATLQHPNIAQVHAAWRERGTVVIVTEWVRGINLKDRVRRVAPFPLAVAMDIILACAEVLNYAHDRGYVHGDVRPDNIIITPEGRVKVTDFGLGASVASSQRIQLAALPRAVYYLAPELVEGRVTEAATDIYSLGCILYEMLAGVVPYDAETSLSVAAKHLHQPVPSLQKANPQVPNAVAGIAAKCMQKNPLDRYLTVQELIADIQKVREAIRANTSLDWTPLKMPEESPALPKESKPRAARREKPAEREREAPSGPSMGLLAGLGLFAVVMVAGFAFYMSTLLFGNPFNGGPREVSVPAKLVGMQQQQALEALKSVGLTADIREDFSEKPGGIVYDTAPKSGVEMRTGRPVILFVSKGTEPITVPDVVGKKRAEAQQLLQTAGLVMSDTKTEFSEIYDKGEVIAQSPIGGTQTKKKSPITLIVSKGAEPAPPDEPVAVESPEAVPDKPADPAPDPVPAGEMPVREHEVSIRVPRSAKSGQTVKIIVRNEDGSEQTVYEQEHQPGEDVKETVSTLGNKGKCQIRVYLNDREISRTDV
jgi:serine/threonine-protein kinase